MLNIEQCKTPEEREKALIDKFGNMFTPKEFCYLNSLMRVRFPFSDGYIKDDTWQRNKKIVAMLETILKMVPTTFDFRLSTNAKLKMTKPRNPPLT